MSHPHFTSDWSDGKWKKVVPLKRQEILTHLRIMTCGKTDMRAITQHNILKGLRYRFKMNLPSGRHKQLILTRLCDSLALRGVLATVEACNLKTGPVDYVIEVDMSKNPHLSPDSRLKPERIKAAETVILTILDGNPIIKSSDLVNAAISKAQIADVMPALRSLHRRGLIHSLRTNTNIVIGQKSAVQSDDYIFASGVTIHIGMKHYRSLHAIIKNGSRIMLESSEQVAAKSKKRTKVVKARAVNKRGTTVAARSRAIAHGVRAHRTK